MGKRFKLFIIFAMATALWVFAELLVYTELMVIKMWLNESL